ncbi:hypothetical protein RFI_12605 [Reticulomyxa filosa]|uniref:Uncharacterized protein n=1 Tax=Reticulomyxa filosa TaxID=46433 RepID=X6NF68_RETFI|nr:hypothetical protein RFI_12605 [Reticulomyxa filosa]|eukprot:ETO24553.1 hypothetical protein RFI_12605 [Reticulomyxa filosa]
MLFNLDKEMLTQYLTDCFYQNLHFTFVGRIIVFKLLFLFSLKNYDFSFLLSKYDYAFFYPLTNAFGNIAIQKFHTFAKETNVFVVRISKSMLFSTILFFFFINEKILHFNGIEVVRMSVIAIGVVEKNSQTSIISRTVLLQDVRFKSCPWKYKIWTCGNLQQEKFANMLDPLISTFAYNFVLPPPYDWNALLKRSS